MKRLMIYQAGAPILVLAAVFTAGMLRSNSSPSTARPSELSRPAAAPAAAPVAEAAPPAPAAQAEPAATLYAVDNRIAERVHWLQPGVKRRLANVAKKLGPRVSLLVTSAYRTHEEQHAIRPT